VPARWRFDHRALGAATALRDAHGGEVVALTMGRGGARRLIVCWPRRADAVHVSDPLVAAPITLATARVLRRRSVARRRT
jgi:electron transfer flavoprotein alpha/beta subunit